ncbi:MAG: F0F1 ATP synthase subunit B [Mycobacteriales bacterium]
MRDHAASIFLLPNATFIAELVAFVIILVVLGKYVVPPVQKAMRDRQELIRTQLEESREAKDRMEAAEKRFDEQLAEARNQAAQIREGARADAQKILEDVKAKAQAEADRITARGEEQLAASRRQVISELRGDIGTMSVQLASRLIGDSLQDGDRRGATVDRFLDELDGMSADRAGAAAGSDAQPDSAARH